MLLPYLFRCSPFRRLATVHLLSSTQFTLDKNKSNEQKDNNNTLLSAYPSFFYVSAFYFIFFFFFFCTCLDSLEFLLELATDVSVSMKTVLATAYGEIEATEESKCES